MAALVPDMVLGKRSEIAADFKRLKHDCRHIGAVVFCDGPDQVTTVMADVKAAADLQTEIEVKLLCYGDPDTLFPTSGV